MCLHLPVTAWPLGHAALLVLWLSSAGSHHQTWAVPNGQVPQGRAGRNKVSNQETTWGPRPEAGGWRREGLSRGGEGGHPGPGKPPTVPLSSKLWLSMRSHSWTVKGVAGARGKLGGTAECLVHREWSVSVCWRKYCLGVSWRLSSANSLSLLPHFSLHLSYEGRGKLVWSP